jgi:cobalt-zinc-cadmium efflux system outer membrane protein
MPLMRRSGKILLGVPLVLLCGVQAGCAGLPPAQAPLQDAPAHRLAQPDACAVRQAAHCQEDPPRPAEEAAPLAPPPAPLQGLPELTAEALVEQVLARNPSLAQIVAAWQAAQARYPQVTSLDDPMFAGTLGPATYGSNTVNPAYRLEIGQKYPYPGKLGLRGQNALAEARAASNEVGDMRLQLIESAKSAFTEYYLVARALEVNDESLRLLREFKKNAETRYTTARGAQQDILQADVEIGRETQRRVTLERMQQVAVARINTLIHLPPDAPLPPAPREAAIGQTLPDAQQLRAVALARRPDLQALMNRIAADEASLGLARKEYYPDFEPFFMYDRFMGNTSDSRPLAYMLGLKMNLPVRLARREGSVAEAVARLAQRRAELARQTDQVNFQVQEAHAQVSESERNVRLYRDKILPAARLQVKAAEQEYMTGKVPFVTLIEAQRNVIGLQDRLYESVADYLRRLAALERAIGGPLAPPPVLGPGVPVPLPVPACPSPAQLGLPQAAPLP